jgi:hypothetical protein
MVFKLLTSRWTWTFLILILLISLIVFMFNSKHLVDNFTDLDLSCYAIQNKYYHTDELLHKSRCPNLVILEKLINGRTAFFAEQGDHNGPYYSKDYTRYYYMGVSPDGLELDLNYDLYYYPWYNPYRWFNRPYGYYPRIRGNLRRKWYDKWNDYKHRLDGHHGHHRHYKHHKYDKPIKKIVKSHKVQSPKAVSHKAPSPKAPSPKRNKLTTLHGASARL